MRIGFLTRHFPLPPRGDPQIQVYEFAKRLAADGHDVIIMTDTCERNRDWAQARHSWVGNSTYRDDDLTVEFGAFRAQDLFHGQQLINMVSSQKLDILVIVGLLFAVFLELQRLWNIENVDVFCYVSKGLFSPVDLRELRLIDLVLHPVKPLNPTILANWLPGFIVKRYLRSGTVKRWIVPSNRVKQQLTRHVNADNICVIPSGVDVCRLRALSRQVISRESLGLPDQKFLIIHWGRAAVLRGPITILKAFDLAVEKYDLRDLSLMLFLLPDSDDSYIRRIADSISHSDKVSLRFGYIPRIFEMASASDVALFPFSFSWAVPEYPLSVIEAMALGKTVIGTRVSAMSELIEHQKSAILVEPGRYVVEELAAQIKFVYDHPEFADSLGLNAMSKSKEYDLSRLYQQFKRIIGV